MRGRRRITAGTETTVAIVLQLNLFAKSSAEDVVIAPGIAGGANWSPSALVTPQAWLGALATTGLGRATGADIG